MLMIYRKKFVIKMYLSCNATEECMLCYHTALEKSDKHLTQVLKSILLPNHHMLTPKSKNHHPLTTK